MPKPLPIHASNSVTTMAGTAFLVTDEKSTWLVTCVHAFSNLTNTPNDARFFERSHVRVLDEGPLIPLFAGVQKRFVVCTEGETNILWDVISIKLAKPESAVLASFGAFRLDQIGYPKSQDDIMIEGFPSLESRAIPFSTMNARIVDVRGASIEFDKPSIPGWSGSPVVQGGTLVGMVHADRGPPSNPQAGLAINLELFKKHLFV